MKETFSDSCVYCQSVCTLDLAALASLNVGSFVGKGFPMDLTLEGQYPGNGLPYAT